MLASVVDVCYAIRVCVIVKATQVLLEKSDQWRKLAYYNIKTTTLRFRSRHLVATNRQPVATNRQPVATNRQPVATNRQLVATNRQPVATNRQPVATNQLQQRLIAL